MTDIPKVLQSMFFPDRTCIFRNPDGLHLKRINEELFYVKNNQELFNDIIELVKIGPLQGDKNEDNSLLAFLLGITNVEPNINEPFTFEIECKLNRFTPPDIDTDFEDRDAIFNYLFNKYGYKNCSFIGANSKCQARAAVQHAFKIHNVCCHGLDADKTAKMISKKVKDKPGLSFQEAIDTPELEEFKVHYPQYFDLAERLFGMVIHEQTHPAGIIVTDKPLSQYVPMKSLAKRDGGKKGERVMVTEYDCTDAENVGLIKNDFLGLQTLFHLHTTSDEVFRRHGIRILPKDIPLEDPETLKIYQNLDTGGVFQMESPAMKSVIKNVHPTSFTDVVAVNALCRPGPMMEKYPEKYGQFKQNPELVTYYHHDMKSILKDTYGLFLYQEQVMKVTRVLAGFGPTQADKIRKFIGKKQTDEAKKKPIRDMFLQGCAKTGKIDEHTALQIWQTMERFGEYAFNKTHSVIYGVISWQTAWFKAHYYVEFMAGLLTSLIHNKKDPTSEVKLEEYKKEFKKKGYKIITPDVNFSKDYFSIVDDKTIVEPFHVSKGIGKMVGTIISKHQPFSDIQDFCDKLRDEFPSTDVIEIMIENDYFRSFGDKNQVRQQINILRDNDRKDKNKNKIVQSVQLTVHTPWSVLESQKGFELESKKNVSAKQKYVM